jgi:hypothetical protein
MGTPLLFLALGALLQGYDATDQYDVRRIEDWTVRVHKAFLKDEPELADRTLAELRSQLRQVARRLPEAAVAKLRKIPIWVELNHPKHPCMAFHPSAKWLKENGMNPDKEGAVEIANARNFLKWTIEQPWMVLHELAHGYHRLFLERGFDNPDIRAAWERAVASKSYDSVLRINGRRERAYAMTDPMEYFAEATEAFFGTNDFFPFVRAELAEHDPDMFKLLERLWREP